MAIKRLRVLDKAYEEIKAQDRETGLSKYQLRGLVLSGVVRSVMIGRMRLIDMDSIEEYLAGSSTSAHTTEGETTGTIRRIQA